MTMASEGKADLIGRRTRVVYFRMREDEVEYFRRLGELLGARSLSELVRAALYRLSVHEPLQQDQRMQLKLQTIEDMAKSIDGRLRELSLSLVKAASAAESGNQSADGSGGANASGKQGMTEIPGKGGF
jgi:hypothetical protein